MADFNGAQDDKAFLLTLTERELVRLVAHDLTPDEIARRTGWTPESVSRRLTRISAKLQGRSQLDIATWARTYLATADDVC